MPALYVETNGVKYFHWGVVLAMLILMVMWFLKCGYPWGEGMVGRNRMDQYSSQMSAKLGTVGANQTSANVRYLEQDQANFQSSVSGKTGVPGVKALAGVPDFGSSPAQTLAMQKAGFLNGPQSPWVPAPELKYTGHNYLKAVHDTADKTALQGFIGGLEAWEVAGGMEGASGGPRSLASDSAAPGLADGYLASRIGK